ncbi:MAG: haloacid dehalogenase domain protein hydrolase [Mycobacterium sp.]|nr:haloacid dehalogenase domain protein hydrolase [Mycobacterium sp.]
MATGHLAGLVLWDIDHTLIETGGVGRQLYVSAFEAVTGRPMKSEADPTGRTEPAIFAETLERHGIASSREVQERYATELARQYEEHARRLAAKGRALPGADLAIAALADASGVVQSVLTGNLRAVAATKLRVFGLDGGLDLDVGSYGEDDRERARLVAVAQARASQKYGVRFDRTNTVIVGDTSSDVLAAHEGGARIVGVASGRDGADELRQAGAEVVLPDLGDTARVVSAISGVISGK